MVCWQSRKVRYAGTGGRQGIQVGYTYKVRVKALQVGYVIRVGLNCVLPSRQRVEDPGPISTILTVINYWSIFQKH